MNKNLFQAIVQADLGDKTPVFNHILKTLFLLFVCVLGLSMVVVFGGAALWLVISLVVFVLIPYWYLLPVCLLLVAIVASIVRIPKQPQPYKPSARQRELSALASARNKAKMAELDRNRIEASPHD